MNANRQGFTLVELLVVVVVAGLVMGMLYQTMSSQTRAYRQSDARISAQQLTRAVTEALAFELRELSASAPAEQAGSDIAGMGVNWIEIRAMRKMGITCMGAPGGLMVVYEMGDPFARGDSLLVYAENEITDASDDAWLQSNVDLTVAGGLCPPWNAYPLATLTTGAALSAGTVRAGAPVRAFEWLRYEVVEMEGQWVLGRRRGDTIDPLIGPLLDENGIAFRYFDANGAETAEPTQVSRVEITVRGASNLGIDGVVGDSITTQVNLRNNRRT